MPLDIISIYLLRVSNAPFLFFATPFILNILWTSTFWQLLDFSSPTLSKTCHAYSDTLPPKEKKKVFLKLLELVFFKYCIKPLWKTWLEVLEISRNCLTSFMFHFDKVHILERPRAHYIFLWQSFKTHIFSTLTIDSIFDVWDRKTMSEKPLFITLSCI